MRCLYPPSSRFVSRLAWHELIRAKRQYAVEVMGDPWDAFGPGTMPVPSGLCIDKSQPEHENDLSRRRRSSLLEWFGAPAKVSGRERQLRSGFSFVGSSNGFASEELMAKRSNRLVGLKPSPNGQGENTTRVGFVGSLAQLYKGPDTFFAPSLFARTRVLISKRCLSAKAGIVE